MFTNPRDPDNKIITNKITEWVLSFDSVPKDVTLQVREVTCNDSSCNHTETHITLEGSTNYKKELIIRKPLVYIRKWDIDL